MNLNEKFAKAIDNSLEFKGVTVLDRQLQTIINLDEENEKFEVGIHCSAIDGTSFLYQISEMLKKGEVELKFKENDENVTKYIEYLKNLDI